MFLERNDLMKVFISWSGEKSNEIAEAMKKWIKLVIQTVEPFVSSQDVPAGARWSSDIAKELQDTNFGILCVTKDNYQEPWLLFEAGALSKTIDKSYVVPLLFDLETSDLTDSPLLQFQASSFGKEDIRKLIFTLNEASDNTTLDVHDLDEMLDVWYPKLEETLKVISSKTFGDSKESSNNNEQKNEQIMDEILDLTRTNQKLLRTPDEAVHNSLSEITSMLNSILEKNNYNERKRNNRFKSNYFIIEDLAHGYIDDIRLDSTLFIMLSIIKEPFPWIFEDGQDLISVLKSKKPREYKENRINNFLRITDITLNYINRMASGDHTKENYAILREIAMFIDRNRERLIEQL
jgi:ElaB/YqjD/DUF883 family membrane-anchored ribosome-binding protein